MSCTGDCHQGRRACPNQTACYPDEDCTISALLRAQLIVLVIFAAVLLLAYLTR